MGRYPDDDTTVAAQGSSVLQAGRRSDRRVAVPADLPCNVIVVHGVNDVGVSYEQVEQGLCAGLSERLKTPDRFRPATYRMPTRDDKGKVVDDPDAVFFKRQHKEGDHTPVIPFYWGFREEDNKYKSGSQTTHGQALDRYGNRLDKDFSKGGGPFANATNSLPDMWGRGRWSAGGFLNRRIRDPLRPLLDTPGRMYMVLAAQRLAALVSMMRDWHADEVVNIVAHSQGCMLSLLAQAFLMQEGLRPADTLVLTHPPYSLVDDFPFTADVADRGGEGDASMKGREHHLAGGQTLHARLTTLVNIVQGVVGARHASPNFSKLRDPLHRGMVGARWEPAAPERDNRGKVYLYFCPEDTTVALDNVLGIGWQGVPEFQGGSRLERQSAPANTVSPSTVMRRPLAELGPGFFQRVFTLRKRPHPASGQPVLVGQAAAHDFALRVDGEGGFEHVDKMTWHDVGRYTRSAHPATSERQATANGAGPATPFAEVMQRRGLRRITGEPLPRPVAPDMFAGAVAPAERPKALQGAPAGAYEGVDPIDAAIASTQDFGYETVWQMLDDLPGRAAEALPALGNHPRPSPRSDLFAGVVVSAPDRRDAALARINRNRTQPADRCQRVERVYACVGSRTPEAPSGRWLVERLETPNEARLRWQESLAERSFHGAIFGSRENHRNVTAYDLAIGGGRASSNPAFYAYLCAVADWRLTKSSDIFRPGITRWDAFEKQHGKYLSSEPPWRRKLIEGNAVYYSTGDLPSSLPLLPERLPRSVLCETMSGRRHKPSSVREPLAPSPEAEKVSPKQLSDPASAYNVGPIIRASASSEAVGKGNGLNLPLRR